MSRRRRRANRWSRGRSHDRAEHGQTVSPHEFFRELAAAQAQVTGEILSEGKTEEKIRELGDNAVGFADGIAEEVKKWAPPRKPSACREGCSWCCRLHVDVTAIEAFRIADFLRETLSPDELKELRARLDQLARATEGMTPWQRALSKLPCALLANDRCSVYAVRPLACRGWNSSDEELCRKGLDAPGTVLDGDHMRKQVFDAVGGGLAVGLVRSGFAGSFPLELTRALLAALEPRAKERWLAGDRAVFVRAKLRQ